MVDGRASTEFAFATKTRENEEILIDEHIDSLEDVEFRGFVWKGNDLILYVRGKEYSELSLAWAYDLVLNLTWELEHGRKSGPLLSTRGSAEKLEENLILLAIDFGSDGFLSVKCSEVSAKE